MAITKDIWSNEQSMKYRGGFPLRPPAEAAESMFKIVSNLIIKKKLVMKNVCMVLLGVTPEISSLPWSNNINLKAFDKNKDMIKHVWVPPKKISSSVSHSLWEKMPLESRSVHFVLGDGCTTQLPNKRAYKVFFKEQRRIIKNEGFLLLRCFLNTQRKESNNQIIKSTLQGRIQFFGSLKWRIAMTLLSNHRTFSIKVKKIYKAFNTLFPSRDELVKLCHWDMGLINTIDTYKNSDMSYTFPSLKEFKILIAPHFEIIKIYYPHYELTKRCPIILMKPI